jgi:hypothetical protein
MLLCGQGAASVKHVARYNNSTTSAVAFPADRNEANLAPGGGCCHSCTLDIKRGPSARRKKRQGMRVLSDGVRGGSRCARRWALKHFTENKNLTNWMIHAGSRTPDVASRRRSHNHNAKIANAHPRVVKPTWTAACKLFATASALSSFHDSTQASGG